MVAIIAPFLGPLFIVAKGVKDMRRQIVSKTLTLILVLGFLVGAGWMTSRTVRAASNWYVAPTGADTNDCATPDTPCLTIQAAIGKAAAGDTVYVALGTYNTATTIVVDKALTISGPTTGVAKVVGTATDMFKVFVIASGDVILQNLEITLDITPAYPLLVGDELNSSLISIPGGAGMTGISIKDNVIYVPEQSLPMSQWTARAITVGSNTVSGMSITGNTIYNTRNGVVIHYNNLVTISGNTIYHTKGGIMNYTGSQADADNRIMSNNSWTATHSEWDIVWNSGGGPYQPDYGQSVLGVSNQNNGAYVISLMTTGDLNTLTGNRSHIFVDNDSSFDTMHKSRGNFNEPFKTIALGIEAVVPGGTVYVAEGTYVENVIINKSLTLLGDPGDASAGPGVNAPIVDGLSTPGSAFFIANGVSNVTIQGFEMRGFTSDDTGVGNGISAWVGSTSNITVQDNYFHDLEYNGILVGNDYNADPSKWGDHTNWLIKGNIADNIGYISFELTNTSNSTIEGNVIHLDTPDIGAIFISARRSESGLTISDNLIDGTPSTAFPVIYIYAYDLDMPSPNLDDILIEGNTIATEAATPYHIYLRNIGTGTVTGVEVHNNSMSTLKNLTAVGIDAENNYWGTTVFSEIVPKISGTVDWSPWCNSDFTACTNTWPVHNTTQGTDHLTIQAAIDAANAGDVILADAGTYVENVIINKSVTLYGAGAGSTIVMPAVSNPNPCTGSSMCGGLASNVLLVEANNVVIHDLTVDGDNPNLTSGIVRNGADLDARNGIIKNTNATYNGLEVYNVTTKNIYLRGIYSTGGTFNFHHNTVTNVQGDDYSIAIFAWGGPGTIANNTVSLANDGISANHSSGIQFLNNVITQSGSGIHTDNSGDGGGVADLIQGNSVDCTGVSGAYGIWTFVPYLAPTVNNNTITNCDVGLSAWGQGAAVTHSFTNNTVTGNGAAGSAGVYVTTDLIGWGYTDITVDFRNNSISGFETGVALTADPQASWNPEPYTAQTINAVFYGNSFEGNTTVMSLGTQGTYNVDASANWWSSAVPATVKAAANGGVLVDYTPWLASGADTSADPGFQGDFSTLWVDDDSPQTGTTGRIQEGIDLVSGSTVNVAAGTYVESNILIDKSATIQGMGATRGDVVLVPAAEDANVDNAFGSDAQNGFIVRAHDVTIKNLTLDGQGNPALTAGKNNYRSGIVSADATYPGGGGGTWNNLHVDNVHIKYPYRRGISVFPNTVTGTLIENSRVEYVAFNHGMYVAGQSQVLNNEVHRAFQGIVVAMDPTTPAGLVKINGNTLTEIGNFAGCWGYNAGDGSYGGQPRAIQFNNSDGAGRQVEIKGNVISDNGLEEYGGAVGIYTRLANSDSVVENNTITLTSGVSWSQPGSQAVGMLLGWSYNNGFLVKNNQVNSTKYGIGVMIFGNGTEEKPLKLEGNTITSTNSQSLDTGDGTGIYIANQYLFASDKNPSYVILQNGNHISGFVTGVAVEAIPTSSQPLTLIAHGNNFAGNTTYALKNTTTTTIDAKLNWWGSICGPGSLVVGPVDYNPWWGDAAGTFEVSEGASGLVIPNDATGAEANAILACATPYSTVDFEAGGTFGGGIVVSTNGLTLNLNGGTVGAGSPAFTINADDVTINGPGVLDGDNDTSPGILVNAGADNFILDGVEVREWANGVQLAGDVTSFKIVSNWIHSNTGNGLLIDADVDLGGVVTIEGNLFKVNGGNGIQHNGNGTLPATYNSWGDVDGPLVGDGDGISASVTYDPWTFAEIYLDVDPVTSGDQVTRNVIANDAFDVAFKVEAQNLYGLAFSYTYSTSLLTLNSTTFTAPWIGRCTNLSTPGEVAYFCYLTAGPEWDGGTVATFNFSANGAGLTGDGPWTAIYDISHLEADTSAGAIGGVKVFVNNAGYNDPSTADRDITDANDGQIIISTLANFTGFINLQGRTDDSGAVIQVYGAAPKAGAVLLAQGASVSSGAYTTAYEAGQQLTVGTRYWFQVDRALYVPTTAMKTITGLLPAVPDDWQNYADLLVRPLTTLNTVILLGGDATDDDMIELSDAVCIGAQYGSAAPVACGTGADFGAGTSADVNGDGKVDLLDLVLMGGNYEKNSSPWIPQ